MKIVEKRKGENQKDGEGKGRNKRVEKRRDEYIQAEQARRGKKEHEVSESIRTELTQDLIPCQEILYQLLQLNFGQVHLKRLHEKSREEKGKESEGWRR